MINSLVNCNYWLNSNWWSRASNKNLNEKICNTDCSFIFHTLLGEQFVCVLSRSIISDLCDHRTIVHQAPLPMVFSRQEYWGEFPCPPSGGLFQLRDRTQIFCIGRKILYHWATQEVPRDTIYSNFKSNMVYNFTILNYIPSL